MCSNPTIKEHSKTILEDVNPPLIKQEHNIILTITTYGYENLNFA